LFATTSCEDVNQLGVISAQTSDGFVDVLGIFHSIGLLEFPREKPSDMNILSVLIIVCEIISLARGEGGIDKERKDYIFAIISETHQPINNRDSLQ